VWCDRVHSPDSIFGSRFNQVTIFAHSGQNYSAHTVFEYIPGPIGLVRKGGCDCVDSLGSYVYL